MSIMYMKINELELAEKMANMALEAFDISYCGFFYLLYPIFALGQLYFVRGRNQQFLHVCEILKYFAQHFEMAKLCLHQLALYEQGVILPQLSEYHFVHAGASYVQQQNGVGQPAQQQPAQQRSLQQPNANFIQGQGQVQDVYGYYDKYTPSPVITQYMTGANQNQAMSAGYNDMITYQQQMLLQQQQQQQMQQRSSNVSNNATMQDAYPRNQM